MIQPALRWRGTAPRPRPRPVGRNGPMSMGSFSIIRAMTSSAGCRAFRRDRGVGLDALGDRDAGEHALVSTPWAANAIDRFREKLTSAALAAEYGPKQGSGSRAKVDAMLTIRPLRCAGMIGTHASASAPHEKKFCSKPCCQSSSAELEQPAGRRRRPCCSRGCRRARTRRSRARAMQRRGGGIDHVGGHARAHAVRLRSNAAALRATPTLSRPHSTTWQPSRAEVERRPAARCPCSRR